jgi:hypothetical protein
MAHARSRHAVFIRLVKEKFLFMTLDFSHQHTT